MLYISVVIVTRVKTVAVTAVEGDMTEVAIGGDHRPHTTGRVAIHGHDQDHTLLVSIIM